MPQQLIYTSAPRGVVAGRSGHCTVARSAAMREALMLQLEKFSYYQHLSLSGGQERPLFCCRIVDLRGSRYHILTRIQDAGLDFTGRTNFLAHHLVFTPEEIRNFPSPPVILRDWPGWIKSWAKDPKLLETEDWTSLTNLPRATAPAVQWQQLTGDATNGYGLLEARSGIAFQVDNLSDEQVLSLFAESLELLEMRDPRRDFRASAWQYTFTTSMQEQDNPADFRWRCLHSDNPASNRFAGPDTRALSDVRVLRATSEEAIFARSGRQPPRFVVPPQNVSSVAGTSARLHAKAEGVPTPAYQWFAVDRSGGRQVIANATSEELVVSNPPLGVTRYAIRASNSEGEITSDVITLSVEQKGQPTANRPTTTTTPGRPPSAPHIKSAGEIEQQRQRLEAEQGENKKTTRKWPLFLFGILVPLAILTLVALHELNQKRLVTNIPRHDTNAPVSNPPHASNTNAPPKQSMPVVTAETNKPTMPFSTGPTSPVSTDNVPFSDTVAQLPAPWAARRIGYIQSATSVSANKAGDFIVHGAGQSVDPHYDNFFFVQRTASNSVEITSRVKTADRQLASRHGIMMRESIGQDASFAFVGLSKTSIFWAHRDLTSAAFQFTTVPIAPLPLYLRLVRRNNDVSSAYSTNGSNWTWLGTNQVAFSDKNFLVGLAVSSGNASSVQTIFDQVAVKNL